MSPEKDATKAPIISITEQPQRSSKHVRGASKPVKAVDDDSANDIFYRKDHSGISGIDVNKESSWNHRKLVIVGDTDAGKSSLLLTFTKGRFPEVYVPAVAEQLTPELVVDGKLLKLALWDTLDDGHSERLRPLSYPDSNVIVVTFSLDSSSSLEYIWEKWMPELLHFCADVPMLLVGTKKDLRDAGEKSVENQDSDSMVSSEQGEAFAKKAGFAQYLECSAKTGEGVKEVFTAAARVAMVKRRSVKRCRGCVVM